MSQSFRFENPNPNTSILYQISETGKLVKKTKRNVKEGEQHVQEHVPLNTST